MKRLIALLLAVSLSFSLVACSESSEYLESLQAGIDEGVISKAEAEELTVYLTENITEDIQIAIPEGEIPEGEISMSAMPGMESIEINPFLGAVEDDIAI